MQFLIPTAPPCASSRSSASMATATHEKKKVLPSEIPKALKALSAAQHTQEVSSPEKSRLLIVWAVFLHVQSPFRDYLIQCRMGRNRDYQSSLELLSACTQLCPKSLVVEGEILDIISSKSTAPTFLCLLHEEIGQWAVRRDRWQFERSKILAEAAVLLERKMDKLQRSGKTI